MVEEGTERWRMREMELIDKLDESSLKRAPGKHHEIDRDGTISSVLR